MTARILVVDDEQIIIASCLRILAGSEYTIEGVNDGFEALRRIEANPVDIVILDIMMPKIDGVEVLRRIKEEHPDIDVIMITGLSEIETAVKSQVQRFIADMDLVKREDYDALRELVAAQSDDIAQLKKDLAALKAKKKAE